MSYDYVKRTYSVQPIVGERVFHTETKEYGTVARENKGQSHHVMVMFDGRKHSAPCHPTALQYFGSR